MAEDQIAKSICFWTDAKPKEVQDIAKQASLDLPFTTAQENPHGAVILAMGTARLKQLQQRGVLPKNRTLESARGKLLPSNNGPILVTFDPSIRHVRADAISQIIWDLRLAQRFVKTGTLKPTVGKYHWSEDLSEFIEECKALIVASPTGQIDVAGDTETMGLFPWYRENHILTVQFSHTEGTATCVRAQHMSEIELKHLKTQVHWLLNNPAIKMKGANFKFDLVWFAIDWGIECSNFSMDTTIVGSMVNENRSNSLKWHICEYTDGLGGYEEEFEATHDKAHLETVQWHSDPTALTYTGGDADGCLRVANVLRKELSKERYLQRLYVKIVHPAVRAFEKVERRGILVDTEKMAAFRSDLGKFIDDRETEMLKMVPPRLRHRYSEKIQDQLAEGKAPLTSAMLGAFFFEDVGLGLTPRMMTPSSTPEKPRPSTAHEHLTMFYDVPEAKAFVELMTEANSARKMRSTYVDGYLKHLRPDGKLHPTCMLFKGSMFGGGDDEDESGTSTGRTAFKDPAFQCTPKHPPANPKSPFWAKRLRQCFPAPPGYVWWGRDFKQGELKIVACVAGEQKMIDVYKEGTAMNKLTGGDLHALTGSKFAGFDDVAMFFAWQYVDEKKADFKQYRQYGKHGNFGMLYGISPGGFQKYAWRKGVLLTEEQAAKYLNDFFELYSGLKDYHTNQKNFARNNGFVMSPLGRIRHLPLIKSSEGFMRGLEERRAINAPIQSTLSDLCIWSVAEIERQLGDDAGIVAMIHDQIAGHIREDKVSEVLPRIGEIMENLPYHKEFEWDPPLTFTSDAEVGATLGDLKEWHPEKMAS